jgi:DNA-directed RNA polymerase I subunit RPA2
MPSKTGATVKPRTTFDTLKREHLFKNPPKDKTAFPALTEAVRPHVDSFNAVTEEGGFLDLARKDIGIKSVFDGALPTKGNKISCRFDAELGNWRSSRLMSSQCALTKSSSESL